MVIVYDSLTGLGKKFAESLGYPIQCTKCALDGECLLVTRNVGLGKIPPSTIEFLDKHKGKVVGVVVNGSKRFGPWYCKAADKIHKQYGIPIVKKISGSGNIDDVNLVKEFLTNRRTYGKDS